MSNEDELTLYDFVNKKAKYDNLARYLFKEKVVIADWFLKQHNIEIKDDRFNVYGLKFINEYFCSKNFRPLVIRTTHLTEDYNGRLVGNAIVKETEVSQNDSIVIHLVAVLGFADSFQGLYPLIPQPPITEPSIRI